MEARHWFSRPRDGEVLIVITAGDFSQWNDIRQHLLPPTIRENLRTPALWVSLQKRRDRMLSSPKDPTLREELTEDLRQILLRFYPDNDWGQLRGEESVQRRRAVRLISATSGLFLLLAMLAVGFATYAQHERLVAESRALAAEAGQQVADQDRPQGLTSALQAWERIEDRKRGYGLQEFNTACDNLDRYGDLLSSGRPFHPASPRTG